jgi:hypothetical protein
VRKEGSYLLLVGENCLYGSMDAVFVYRPGKPGRRSVSHVSGSLFAAVEVGFES